ncbi:MAG: glucose 1-dehydrogenase [Anaerolineaceae bacterium]|nr:glucose 1-dehydrogenase [Anaerolineaceae bacterium]
MSRLAGKVALITGAASNPGLGFSTACRFALEGAKLLITDIDEDGLRNCEAEIRMLGGEVISCRHDVTSESDWQRAINLIVETWGKLDVLVNNAGIAVLGRMTDMSLAAFDKQMLVNMTSVFLGTKYAIPAMQANGGGSIVNISSMVGLVGMPGSAAYAASKAGVRSLGKTVAVEWAKESIRCNSVLPGVIMTNLQNDPLRENPEQFEAFSATIPMGHMGEPDDVANCVLFLASDEAKYITGAEFVVDGGYTAQ